MFNCMSRRCISPVQRQFVMSGIETLTIMKFTRSVRAGGFLSLVTLLVTSASWAADTKPPTKSVPSQPAAESEECSPLSTTTRNASNSTAPASQSKPAPAAKPEEAETQISIDEAPMKVKLELDQDQEISIASSDCSNDSAKSGSEKCREKTKPSVPQCERNSSPDRDLVVPSSNPNAQQE